MSMYNWKEQDDQVKGITTRKHYWHSFLDSKDLIDLRDNWPVIYNSQYHRQENRKSIYTWIGEYKDHLQQNWIADGGLTSTED